MKKLTHEEWDKKLCKEFPLLYRDRFASIQSSCAGWGFDFGVGWMPITYELSSKLEPLIQKWINENNPTKCANCGCERNQHAFVGECTTLHYLPYLFKWKWKSIGWPSKAHNWNDRWKILVNKYFRFYFLERIKNKISRVINFVLDDILHQRFGITKVKPCWCKKFALNHPCAAQMKEKLGSGRFYMTGYLDGFDEAIREWERKTAITCENCSAPAELRNNFGWYSTLCEGCAVVEGMRIPTAKEVEDFTEEDWEEKENEQD